MESDEGREKGVRNLFSASSAFGNDGVGTVGTETTINSGDMAGILMIAVQALEKQNKEIKAENADLKARLERLERMIGAYTLAANVE